MTTGMITPIAVSDVPVGELLSPVDITLTELAIEAVFPPDVTTAEIPRRLTEMPPDHPALGYRVLVEDDAVRIREYIDPDWPSIWTIFQEVVTAGDSYAYDPEWSSARAREVWVEAPPGHTVVADDGSRVLGTAKMGPNRPGPGAHVATASFMVGGEARGRGVGRTLGEYALSWAREQGYAAMQFNAVVESNHAAVRLWRDLGFQIVGTVPEAFAHPTLGRVGLHIMHRYL